ncbi:MAG TPA: hypothetical protein VK897_00825 [Anaerolineales bacterium]|nr:hypothetical protein [Anaerolineales bacterium]
MIDHLIHLYKRGAEPFRTLSALQEETAISIMQSLYRAGSIFWERFEDPVGYLRLRKQIEQSIRGAFIAKGGRPQDAHPIYMALGRTRWMQNDLDAVTLATTTEIEVPLALFDEWDVSFTYPDSMVSFLLANDKASEYYLPDYHGKVFSLSEIRSIVEANGLPGETWGANLPSSMPNYIEAQVWRHEPLRSYKQHLKAHAGI